VTVDASPHTPRKRARWAALAIAAATACGVMAALHVPSMRALLGTSSDCPWGGKPPSAEEIEAQRVRAAVTLKGTTKAPTRPAFGFELDTSTRDDVLAWAKRAGHTCKDELGGAALRCEGVSRGEAVVVRDAFFRFDPRGRLVGVDLMHQGTTAEQAAALLGDVTRAVTASVGAPTATRGDASAARLGEGYLSRAAAEFRFADYAVDLSATNMGEEGVVVRRQYRSVPN